MSIHPSLSSATKGKQQRTVLKRRERIKHLIDKGEWTAASNVYYLPKLKTTKLKVKKIKAEKPKETETTVAQATATAQTTAAPKTAASKKESK